MPGKLRLGIRFLDKTGLVWAFFKKTGLIAGTGFVLLHASYYLL